MRASDYLIGTEIMDNEELLRHEVSQGSGPSGSAELLLRVKPPKIEPLCLEDVIFWSQMKRIDPQVVKRLTNYQDNHKFAPVSHEFVRGLADRQQDFLGRRQWDCQEDGLEYGDDGQCSVWLHIECAAAGTNSDRGSPKLMRSKVMQILGAAFNEDLVPKSALRGDDMRSKDCTVHAPLNWDNRSMLQIALLDEAGRHIRGAAIVYLNGPAFGYVPFFAVAEAHRGNGMGSKFARALISVLRCVGVNTLILEACVNPKVLGKVVRFWEKAAGLERCTDEKEDDQALLTNGARAHRVCGSTIRGSTGVFDFPDGIFMYRGTKRGWKVGHTQVQSAMLKATLPETNVRDSVCATPLSHGQGCEMGSSQVPCSSTSREIWRSSSPREFDLPSESLAVWPVLGQSGQLHTVVSAYRVKNGNEANDRATKNDNGPDKCGEASWLQVDESAVLPLATAATHSSCDQSPSVGADAPQSGDNVRRLWLLRIYDIHLH